MTFLFKNLTVYCVIPKSF